MKLLQIYGKEIFEEIKMKNRFYFIFTVTAISFLFGKFLLHEDQRLQGGLAYAQVKNLDQEIEQKRSDTKEPILEEKEKTEEDTKDKKVALPTEMPAQKSETFRMFETIEKKNQELKRREEELKIKELKIKEIEAKVSKNLEKLKKEFQNPNNNLEYRTKKQKKMYKPWLKFIPV